MADFIPKNRENEIIAAIEKAELNTSGEIRLHIERFCPGPALERAKHWFQKLNMTATKDRNGVLIYVATHDRKVAIFGDEAIHAAVGQDFWEEDIRVLVASFKSGRVVEGLTEVISRIGEKLKTHFPYRSDDKDELSNEISFGKD